MRIFRLILFVLSVTGQPAWAQVVAQVINGETPYDDTMLQRRASATGDRPASRPPPSAAQAPGEPGAAEPSTTAPDRRD